DCRLLCLSCFLRASSCSRALGSTTSPARKSATISPSWRATYETHACDGDRNGFVRLGVGSAKSRGRQSTEYPDHSGETGRMDFTVRRQDAGSMERDSEPGEGVEGRRRHD